MAPRQQADPFTDSTSSVRPTTTQSATHRTTSSQAMRSNTSIASARTRQQPRNDLFAPSLSRRPTSRSTPKLEDEVLADPDSEEEAAAAAATAQRQRQRLRRLRQGSPEAKQAGRSRARKEEAEEGEIVNRQADGGYLLGVSAGNEAFAQHLFAPELRAAQEAEEIDAEDAVAARAYFTSGMALGGRGSKKMEEEYDAVAPSMLQRLREQAILKMESERWMYEPMDRYQARLP